MSLIEVKNVTKIYKQGKVETYALRGATTNINEGDFVVLSGPSGSGKSTLLNIIGTLDTASSGEVIIDGNNVSKMSKSALADFRLNNMGFIFQSYNLFPVLTALENVGLALELKGLPKKEIIERSQLALEDVGLKDFGKRKPSELSGGQQQRVAVARALVSKPRLILGDEPTANLDSKNSESLIDLMTSMQAKYNATVVLSTHDSMVLSKAKRVITLIDGVVVSD
ncbi:MAG: ABC transporter ATP-binding protein [Alphaproteobacteria bacterium]|jgi:putative ABC transport system ATP-binding protein|nr:ABC transporter ATP-binding protein [Alphaproteobacteria bacterium]